MPRTLHLRSLRWAPLALAALWASSAFAGPLPPGAATPTSGITAALAPNLVGTTILDERTPFSFASSAGPVSGEIRQIVVRSSADSTLDFYWQIFNNASSTARLDTLKVFNFNTDPSSLLIADYRADSVGTQPSDFASRSPGLGQDIGFALLNGVGAGQSSRWLMLDSKEREMAKIGKWQAGAIGGGFSDTFATYVPAAPVPEPASAALLAGGLGLVGWMSRRRSTAHRSMPEPALR